MIDRKNRIVELRLGALDLPAQLCWVCLAREFVDKLSPGARVVADSAELCERAGNTLGQLDVKSVGGFELSANELHPDEEFAFISSSAGMHPALVKYTGRLIIEPLEVPETLDPVVHCFLHASGRLRARVGNIARDVLAPDDFEHLKRKIGDMQPALFRAAMISSVFDADSFISDFLSNSAALHGYERCQHFLFRPGSPGQEHEALLDHARKHAGAVYINLRYDPGLYATWNFGCRLARAPLLSNANIDDRRAPEQIDRLAGLLESNPSISVASAALRVTQTPNQRWDEPGEEVVWFAEGVPEKFDASFLIKQTGAGQQPRCVPHCMPLWRRGLHAWYGGFRESLYGPCADWEFWLRAGSAGCWFGHLRQPLGLYLKRPDSHWRANPESESFNRRVIDHYGSDALDLPLAPNAFWLRDFRESVRCGDWLGAALTLIVQGGAALRGIPEDSALPAFVSAAGRRYFGVKDLAEWLTDEQHRPPPALPNLSEALMWMVDWLHLASAGDNRLSSDVLRRYTMIFADLYGQTGDIAAWAACAVVERVRGDESAEKNVLRAARNFDPVAFWSRLQVACRFTVPLGQIARGVEPRLRPAKAREVRPHRIVFFPDYTEKNPYQRLLYQSAWNAGIAVQAIPSLEALNALRPGGNSIVHLHWIHPVVAAEDGAEAMRQARLFLQRVDDWQEEGALVYWTVHNRLSHAVRFPEAERFVRKGLSRRADRVFVHHPLVAELVDWLDPDAQLELLEHGPYPAAGPGTIRQFEARTRLGLDRDDFVLCHVGAVKPYKVLDKCLRALEPLMHRYPRLKVVVAGNVWCKAARAALDSLPDCQILLFDEFAGEDRLELCYHAADFALLTYRDILTSGSLFRAFSSNCPVIAPALGTIPAYVVPGWNGYVYQSDEDLVDLVRSQLDEPHARRSSLRKNAGKTAAGLSWDFWSD